jgi:hypothetical protein
MRLARTVSDYPFCAVFDGAEERGPSHEVVEVEAQVVVFGQRVEVGEVEGEEVCWGHAPDGTHFAVRK